MMLFFQLIFSTMVLERAWNVCLEAPPRTLVWPASRPRTV